VGDLVSEAQQGLEEQPGSTLAQKQLNPQQWHPHHFFCAATAAAAVGFSGVD
jgi:hypothetical protein